MLPIHVAQQAVVDLFFWALRTLTGKFALHVEDDPIRESISAKTLLDRLRSTLPELRAA